MKTYEFNGGAERVLAALVTLCEDPHTEYPLSIVQFDGYPLQFFEKCDLENFITGWAQETVVSAKA